MANDFGRRQTDVFGHKKRFDLRMHQIACIQRGAARTECANCIASRISFCSHIDRKGLAALRTESTSLRVPKGGILSEQNSPATHVYVIIQGTIKLYRLLEDGGRQVTGFLGPGDLLGSPKINGTTHCTAECLTECQLCAFRTESFQRMLRQYPELCLVLLTTAYDEVEAQYEQLGLLGRKHADQRLAAFLLTLAQRWQHDGPIETSLSLTMSRADIADYLGLTVESVSRAMHRLKDLGLVELPKPTVAHLLNLPALQKLSGLDEMPSARVSIGI